MERALLQRGWPASVCRAWPSATAFGGCGRQTLSGQPGHQTELR
jgi:hypothetical protein